MSLQRTIKRNFIQISQCPYSGHYVHMEFFPAEPDTGIVFNVPRGDVKAELGNLRPPQRRTLQLKQGDAKVQTPEHLLAALFANGIDNIRVEIRRLSPQRNIPTKYWFTYHTREYFTARGINVSEVVPIVGDAERNLCERLASEECGPVEQDKERRILRLSEPFETEKISLYPIDGDDIIMQVTTKYKPVGEQTEELVITPETFNREIAGARPYCMHIGRYLFFLPEKSQKAVARFFANFAYPTLGIGHGFNESNVFVPPKTEEEWYQQEMYSGEIARHTMTDKLALFVFLEGRLEGVKMVVKPRSNHENDMNVLTELVKRLKPYKSSSLATPPVGEGKISILSSKLAYTS